MQADVAPSAARFVAHVARALACGVVLFWMVAIVLVRSDGGVPDWWLPVALGLGALVPPPWVPPSRAGVRPSRVWNTTCALLLAIAVAAVVYGALATPSRHWDGAVAFEPKAYWLTQAPTLAQPFFADANVFHHSPDFPLLLPLLVATTERLVGGGLGRLWLPLCYVLLLATVASTAWRAGWSRRLASLLVVCVGLTPYLLGPGGGAVDSGYADVALLLATTLLAAGLLLASPVELALGVVFAIACKPEGGVYALLAAFAAFVAGDRRGLVTVVMAIAAALALWLPTQLQLLHLPARSAVVATTLGIGAAVAGLGAAGIAATQLGRAPLRLRWAAAVFAMLTAAWALAAFADAVPPASAIGRYMHRDEPWRDGLANLGAWALALVRHAVLRFDFGVTFVVVVLLAWRRSRETPGHAGSLAATTFFATGMLVTALPFVLTFEADVQHHLRSSLPRLLLHWLGASWLFVGARLDAALTREPAGAVATGPAS
jgi:hypothetical protein